MNDLEQTTACPMANWSLLTPTVARMLKPAKIPSLQTPILSGEPLAKQDLDKLAGAVHLLNGFGPSECSILACLIKTDVRSHGSPLRIGHALGCKLWISDLYQPDRLLPVGGIGELVFEGPIVGRGMRTDRTLLLLFSSNLHYGQDARIHLNACTELVI